MSSVQTLQSAYAALANNDPSLLFGAMAPDIQWHEAEGNPLADRNPYVGAQAVGEGVFGRLLAAIDGFTAAPDRFVDGGDYVIVLGRYGGTMKHSGAKLDAPFCQFTASGATASCRSSSIRTRSSGRGSCRSGPTTAQVGGVAVRCQGDGYSRNVVAITLARSA